MKWQLCGFLNVTGYCRSWVPNFSLFVYPHCEFTKISVPKSLPWEDKYEWAFIRLKQVLQKLPALGLPNYSQHSLYLYMNRITKPWECSCKNAAISTGMLPIIVYNLIGCLCISDRPSGYSHSCKASVDLTLESDIYLKIPYAVQSLLNSELTHFSESRLTSWDPSAFTT